MDISKLTNRQTIDLSNTPNVTGLCCKADPKYIKNRINYINGKPKQF